MDSDLEYFDDETCRLEPIADPCGPRLLAIHARAEWRRHFLQQPWTHRDAGGRTLTDTEILTSKRTRPHGDHTSPCRTLHLGVPDHADGARDRQSRARAH